MGDRELLGAAAKAAGIKNAVIWEGGTDEHPFVYAQLSKSVYWSPFTDDGDALRLAVKLRLDVHISVCRVGGEDGWYNDLCDSIGVEAATRRAIVRAAASMAGKGTTGETNE